METCFKCGASSGQRVLYDAVSKHGIVKVCERCLLRENIPLIKKSGPIPEDEKEESFTVRERLSYMSGFNPRKDRRAANNKKSEDMIRQEEELKEALAKKYEEELKNSNIKADAAGENGMIRNFHWAIMRARRAKHLTQKELARSIAEPEVAIKLAEQGMLPREHEALVRKIQNFLNIQITKIPYDTYAKLPEKENAASAEESYETAEFGNEEIQLDSEKERRWTIGDLLRIKKRVRVKDRSQENAVSISDAINEEYSEKSGEEKKNNSK